MSLSRIPTEAYTLGNLVAKFKFRPNRYDLAFTRGLLIAGGLLACGGQLVIIDEPNRTGSIVLAVGLGMLLVAAAYAAVTALLRRNDRVLVYEHGLVDLRRKKTTVLRWEDIEAVRQAVTPEQQFFFSSVGALPLPVPTDVKLRYFIYVMGRDGERIEYRDDTVRKVDQLGRILMQETTVRLLPAALETFQKGGTLDFYTLSLSHQEGVTRDGETLPWDDVAAISFKRGQIFVQKQGQKKSWARVYVGQTNNVYVFAGILRHRALKADAPAA